MKTKQTHKALEDIRSREAMGGLSMSGRVFRRFFAIKMTVT